MDILPALALLMVLIGGLVVYAFYSFPPAFVEKKTLNVFNNMVMAVGILFCVVFSANIAVFLTLDELMKYRTLLIVTGCAGILTIYLALMFALRNFWIFTSRRF